MQTTPTQGQFLPPTTPSRGWRLTSPITALAIAAGLIASAGAARASNILQNPGFEANSGGVVPTGWALYGSVAPGGSGFWINSDAYAHSGSSYWKQWDNTWPGAGNVSGCYQDKTCAPGWTYAADAWFFTLASDAMGPGNRAWVEVSFRDASNNVLALYKTAEFGVAWGTSTWFDLPVTNVCDISTNSYPVTNTVTQLVAPSGTKAVRYQISYYHNNGDGGSLYLDDAMLNQLVGPVPPVLSNIKPGYMILANPTNGVTFTVSSPSSTTIPNSGIHMTVNGTDVSPSLSISGSASSKNVAYNGLLLNMNYDVSISVTDAQNLAISGSMSFDTKAAPAFLWEAEDFDYTNGLYLNNPQLSATNDNPNSYFGKVGTPEVDEHDASSGSGDHFYRAGDPMATTYSGDWTRQKFVDAGVPDYKVGWFNAGEWVNYTRDFPAGTYNIVARLAGGEGAASVTVSTVNPDTTTTDIGTFSFTGRGWSTYDYVTLVDALGNPLPVTLGGKQTLRATTAGGADMTFFMLVAADLQIPVLGSVYPDGAHPFENTNTFRIEVSSPSSPLNASGIHMSLNGKDVSSSLVVGGTTADRVVTYTGLLPNQFYSVIFTATNTAGKGLLYTNKFDTFLESNYMVDAEDYDFGGGQYIDNPTPTDYIFKTATTNIDYSHTYVDGEKFNFRWEVPTQAATDYLRQSFVEAGATDYNVGWFGYPDWCNYTHNYPAGQYLVYGRFAGNPGVGYSIYLDQVVSGATTENQVTKRLGRWGALGQGWGNYVWVSLTDEGLAAPIILKLGGLATLRLTTTGNVNPNYFMLVPVSPVQLTASRSGGNVALSFPTANSVSYRVFYKTSLASSSTWTLLTTVVGNGSVMTVTDPANTGGRFYEVTSP